MNKVQIQYFKVQKLHFKIRHSSIKEMIIKWMIYGILGMDVKLVKEEIAVMGADGVENVIRSDRLWQHQKNIKSIY